VTLGLGETTVELWDRSAKP